MVHIPTRIGLPVKFRTHDPTERRVSDERWLARALDRAAGAVPVPARIELLRDASENYPAWLEAIESAVDRIFLESYIIHEDTQGRLFADLLIKKAQQGVCVKVIYDWFGALGKTSSSYWRRLRAGGVDVRCFNRFSLLDPVRVFNRDHRKTLIVDGHTAFVSGLCIGDAWLASGPSGTMPWRDTGVRICGPAAAVVEDSFRAVWAATGESIAAEKPIPAPAGGGLEAELRVIQSSPGLARLYRTDHILLAAASDRIWLSDAYFISVPSYLRALTDAAADGVDVRILVPRSSDVRWVREVTRAGYRPLLEAGVRIFEWQGSMMHAKTALFDKRFARVGSTNLNISSWFGNYELDILVDDERFAREMHLMFLRDLENAAEIVLNMNSERSSRPKAGKKRSIKGGSMRKAAAGAVRAAAALGTAMTNRMPLPAVEGRLLLVAGLSLLAFSLLLIKFPRGTSIPIVLLLSWLGLTTISKAIRSYRRR